MMAAKKNTCQLFLEEPLSTKVASKSVIVTTGCSCMSILEENCAFSANSTMFETLLHNYACIKGQMSIGS